jgi:hypothetical protein
MIYIITPCSRPENLEQISLSIPDNCKWIVVYDNRVQINTNIKNAEFLLCPNTGFVGSEARNFFLENYNIEDDDWIYSLDDDNIIHPEFYKNIEPVLDNDYSIIHWGQLHKDNRTRLVPIIKLNEIDTACFLVKWKYNKHIRYSITDYNSDGMYAIECAKNGPALTLYKNLCYYNYLRS